MRLIKAQTTNLRSITGKGIQYDINDQVIIDSNNVLRVPKGTTAQRPSSPTEGHIRYNTDTNEFEGYQNGAYRKFRYKEPNSVGIIQQNLGSGDAVETIFGPLASGDSDYPAPAAAQNVLVFVENVFQISGTNYSLVQNPGASNTISSIVSVGTSTVIETATNHGYTTDNLLYVSGAESTIDDAVENLNTDDSSSPGSHTILSIPALNRIEVAVDTAGGNTANYIPNSGTIFKAGTSTGPYLDGYYLQFTSAPDLDKAITVLHNFDK
tara:strand:+ start:418 stop:1218 length:801 start_codon:yes stop_codon:yes gene_type:complete